MQAITLEQQKFLTDMGWKFAEFVVWGLVAWGGRALWTSIQSIRPGIVADVAEAVRKEFKAHEDLDDSRFEFLANQLGFSFKKHAQSGD